MRVVSKILDHCLRIIFIVKSEITSIYRKQRLSRCTAGIKVNIFFFNIDEFDITVSIFVCKKEASHKAPSNASIIVYLYRPT